MNMFDNKTRFPMFPVIYSDLYGFFKKPRWWTNKWSIIKGIIQHKGYLLKIVNVIYENDVAETMQEKDYCITKERLEEFIPALVDLSMTHVIIGIAGDTVYVSESPDHQTNIDADVVDAFIHLFKRRFRYMVNVGYLSKMEKKMALQNKPKVV